MNTKNNRRARNTDEMLIRAFYKILEKKKTVSKVTVREICEEAGVNRSTFYARYMDVYDLLEKVEETMARRLTDVYLSKLEEKSDLGKGFESLFEFILEYWEFYQIYLNQTHKAGVIGLAFDAITEKAGSISWKDFGFTSQRELEYQGAFFVFGLTAMIRQWVNAGCPESPREMCEILGRQYNPNKAHFEW